MQFLFVQTYFICTRKGLSYILFGCQVSHLIYFISCHNIINVYLGLLHLNLFWVIAYHFTFHKMIWYKILIYCILSNISYYELQLFNVKIYLYTMIYSESKTTIYDRNRFKLLYLCILLLFLWLTKDIPNDQTLMNNQCKTITEVEREGGIHILHYFVGMDFTPYKPRITLNGYMFATYL